MANNITKAHNRRPLEGAQKHCHNLLVVALGMGLLALTTPQNLKAQQRSPAHQAYCLELESELARTIHGSTVREDRASLRTKLREIEQIFHRLSNEAERRGCYNYFLFSKELRRTPRCLRLNKKINKAKRQLDNLNNQLHRNADAQDNARYKQDKIIAALARNQCGPQYQKEMSKRNNLSNWFGETIFGAPPKRDYGPQDQFKFATHRTVCVRLCDGYYFPISFATTTNRFATDQQVCQSRCAAPAELFTYPNPGGTPEQMFSVNGMAYETLKNAWRYKKEFVKGCSCKAAEYNPDLLTVKAEEQPGENKAEELEQPTNKDEKPVIEDKKTSVQPKKVKKIVEK